MDDLVAWLSQQLDEDERLVELQPPWPWRLNAERDEVWAADAELVADVHALSSNQQRNTAEHITRWDPARARREIDAKRRILAEHVPGVDVCDAHDANLNTIPCATLLALALPYSERPGYREEWRP